MVQRDTSSNDNVEKLAREVQQLISEKKKKKKDWKFKNCWFDEKKPSGLDQVMTQSYQRL